MNFVTLEFAAFFLVVLGGGWLLQGRASLCRFFLLFANLAFYAAGGLYFLPLLPAVSFVVWGTGRLLAKDSPPIDRKTVLSVGVGVCLALLALFKYYEFFLQLVNDLLAEAEWGPISPVGLADLPFPIGISFYSFQGIAYIIEQYRNPDREACSYLRILTYLSFFPTVLAGPILRPGEFFPQLDKAPGGERNTSEGAALILSGLFKKVVLASFLSEEVARGVFQAPDCYSSWATLIAVYGYALQIYCDFSGYTDLALGLGRLMGFTLPQNFKAPYLCLNIQDFWRRWHISLSFWLRDYLYIPLGGNKGGGSALCRNLLVTMLLGGLWHGAHLRFLVWGLLHGLALISLHIWRALPIHFSREGERREEAPGALTPARFCSWFLTFHFVCLAWVFFRADDMDTALLILKRLVFWGQPGIGFPLAALPAIAAGLALQWAGPSIQSLFLRIQAALPWPAQVALTAFLTGLILRMGPDGVLPFIYFQF
ncbi:MAG: MBOAT family protein [Desulfovibrio sp.]|jgi:D-alanyl-lipoteichoic acid acyltransferase DltB (MBOAT superfamily)|nr:MBOAT family protein [Desulfovibrio sp.]